MCLDVIVKSESRPEPQLAWKVVTQDGHTPYLEMPLPVGAWLTADSSVRLQAAFGVEYDSGFHCFVQRADAEAVANAIDCRAVPVLVRGVHTRGLEDYYVLYPTRKWVTRKVLVAREMFIPPEPPDLLETATPNVPPDSQTETNEIGEPHERA